MGEKKKAGYTRGPYWDYSRTVPKHLMEVWYRRARLYRLACTFEDFTWLIENETTSLYYKYYSYQARKKKRKPLNENDREPYLRPNYGPKKELSEDQIRKREWKEKFRKDKAKTYWRRGAGKYWKRFSNKMHRQYQRQMICHEEYEDMSESDYKLYIDHWLWD